MSNENFGVYLDAATITTANAAKRGLLDIPTVDENDSLFVRSETNKKWREHMEIKDTKMVPWVDDPEVIMVTVQYKVKNDFYQKNANRIMTKTYFLHSKAFKDATHKDHKRTMMNLGKLNAMIRACGLELEKDDSGRVAYHEYFNQEKPLVGSTFWGIVRDYWYENRSGESVNDQDIDNFITDKP